MRFFSYLIIIVISFIIGMSSLNSLNLIEKKEIVLFYESFTYLEDRYLLEPIINIIAADLES